MRMTVYLQGHRRRPIVRDIQYTLAGHSTRRRLYLLVALETLNAGVTTVVPRILNLVARVGEYGDL